MAGVNAAKVRKDLSYLGSYGTRGVGYDVEYLLFQMSRELGLTQDWPVVIVGVGNLGQALANYGGFGDRGFPVAALVDADPAKVGDAGSATSRSATSTTCPTIVAEREHRHRRSSPRRRAPPRTSPTGSSPPASRSILNFAPAVHLGAARGVSLRKVDLAVELQILSFYQQQRAPAARRSPSPTGDRAGAGRRCRCRSTARCTRSTSCSPGRPCLVVGGGRVAAPEGRRACSSAGAAVDVVAPRGRPTRCGPTPASPCERAAVPRRARLAGYRLVVAATDDPDGQPGRSSDDGEAAGVWVNSADDPAHCSFTLPARVRRGDLLVTVSTGGPQPGASPRGCGGGSRTRSGPSTRRCSSCSPRSGSASAAEGRSDRGP